MGAETSDKTIMGLGILRTQWVDELVPLTFVLHKGKISRAIIQVHLKCKSFFTPAGSFLRQMEEIIVLTGI